MLQEVCCYTLIVKNGCKMQTPVLIWLGIFFCISQSAMFSGLNLAFFSVTRLRLEIEAENDNKAALRILSLRRNSNFLLTTILWGNVGINVLLTLLSNSVMAGISAFVFSTFIITFIGEIFPQAYFSRHALRMASSLAPALRFYQIILYPVSKPSALILDIWLGKETIQYFKERSIKKLISKHIDKAENEIDYVEGIGAINFLTIDDLTVMQEGEFINPESIIQLPGRNNKLIIPDFSFKPDDPFLEKINQSGEKWVIFINEDNVPVRLLDADGFIRAVCFLQKKVRIEDFCHTPLVVTNPSVPIGDVISKLNKKNYPEEDAALEHDVIILWGQQKKIITGADILGRLLKGIASS